MIDGALPFLRCPVCTETLGLGEPRTLRCAQGHHFDIAKQGYATLTRGRMPHVGDSVPMIEARADFLAAGHYRFIADALATAAPPVDGLILDAGAGTGWYLAGLLTDRPAAVGLAVDVSKPALRRAARAHPRAAAVLADLWQRLPIADAAADLILNVFAPRNAAEFHRVLRPGGALLVVTPAPDHLHELITAHDLLTVDRDKADRTVDKLKTGFTAEHTTTHRRRLNLTAAEVRTLIGMTPSARHVDLAETEDRTVTAAVDVTLFRRSDRLLPTPADDRDMAR